MTKNVYSVGQVNNYIKNMFAQDFMLRRISVKGEVSNCKYHTSGHIYFTLKDESGTMNAIMFAGNRSGLSFRMKEGDKIVVTGSIEVYERDGKYQIYAKTIELDGEGDLFLRFEKMKQQLEEMGMFAEEYKQQIPQYARRIGIVTAPTGAAIQDIRNIAYRRNPYIQLILYPALVQGEGAAQSIVNGIHALEALDVDVIIVGRGGGSIEDLWAFNEEFVARAIFECSVPIISAVGHQTDVTISDYVADLRAPTPSAAAELAVYDYRMVYQGLIEYRRRMEKIIQKNLLFSRERIRHYQTRLNICSPKTRMNENKKRLADYEYELQNLMLNHLKEKRHRLQLLAGKLEIYSPAKKLSQGYAFVSGEDGCGLRTVENIKKEDKIQIHLMDGVVSAVVSEVEKNEWRK